MMRDKTGRAEATQSHAVASRQDPVQTTISMISRTLIANGAPSAKELKSEIQPEEDEQDRN
jgi:hypothetical protein